MKVIIQIPCYNEAQTLGLTLAELPRSLPGVDKVEWLVIDDGSSDNTAEVAKAHGVDYVVRHPRNQGLAKAFMTGLRACLERGAGIIVNTDADNQYDASCITDLIRPIQEGRAAIVVGARPIDQIQDFSPVKKMLQKIGSWTVRIASGTDIPDAPSGFRAIHRDAAMRLNVFNNYTYTLETIIQAGQKQIPITWVPVRTNAYLRPSRLVKSIPGYVRRSIVTILRIFVVYRPFRFFASIGIVLFGLGFLLGLRFLFFYIFESGAGHIQSLILAAILLGMGYLTLHVALLADLLNVNKSLLEELRYRELQRDLGPGDGEAE